jgi:hypothetical protein
MDFIYSGPETTTYVLSTHTCYEPRPLRGMSDAAEYWVNDSGEAFIQVPSHNQL